MAGSGMAHQEQAESEAGRAPTGPFARFGRWLTGPGEPPSDFRLVSGLFLRLLALVYLAAFLSLHGQILGLAGSEGILPYAEQIRLAGEIHGSERFWNHPSLFWLAASDTVLRGAAVAGCLFAVLLFFNLVPRVALVVLFALYLSLFQAGQIFLNFQWDYLLLEAGFLAIFLPGGSRVVVWLMCWLLFRLRFLSGISKLVSGDPAWADLTALRYYFETQPLPHWGAWYAHQLPEWVLRAGTGATLAVELVVPFMMFLGRGPRFLAAWVTIAFQVAILLTSNHNFFNLLTIALCLFLFDDRALGRIVPRVAVGWIARPVGLLHAAGAIRRFGLYLLAAVLVVVSSVEALDMVWRSRVPEALATVVDRVRPFRVANRYHVFPTMKTERIEVIVEGSADGQIWHPYTFRFKPGDVGARPAVVLPHQPRLDWMMWFVPLGHPMNRQWYEGFLRRLLDNAPAVVALLGENPFASGAPRYVRASLYRYRFASPSARRETGSWWTREYLGPFYPWPPMERGRPSW